MKLQFKDQVSRSINFNFKEVSHCKNTVLKFYFGLETPLITQYQKFATEHPFGFALRVS